MYNAVHGAVCTVRAIGARCGDYGGEEPSLVDTHWSLSCYHGVQCRTILHTALYIALNTAVDIECIALLFIFILHFCAMPKPGKEHRVEAGS